MKNAFMSQKILFLILFKILNIIKKASTLFRGETKWVKI